MKLNLTDGNSKFTFIIAEDADFEDCVKIRASKRPVAVAINVIRKRIGAETMKGLYPLQAPLEGLKIEQAA